MNEEQLTAITKVFDDSLRKHLPGEIGYVLLLTPRSMMGATEHTTALATNMGERAATSVMAALVQKEAERRLAALGCTPDKIHQMADQVMETMLKK